MEFLTHFKQYIPAPDRLYSAAGSIFVAAAIGASYGLIGRVMRPNAGFSPLNFALWFTIAYQIKHYVHFSEKYFVRFLGVKSYLKELEHVPEDELDLEDQVRYHCWRVIQIKNTVINKIDAVFSKLCQIRPFIGVTADNVKEASFLEMCRYRIWKVFKSTILELISSRIAFHFSNAMGFKIPIDTSVQLFIVIQSIIREILLIPALHIYVRVCNHLVDHMGEKDKDGAYLRAQWISSLLPSL